jgi:hypothetical protein
MIDFAEAWTAIFIFGKVAMVLDAKLRISLADF